MVALTVAVQLLVQPLGTAGDALASTVMFTVLPVPPPVPPLVLHAALFGSFTQRSAPVRVTVAVGEPVAVVKVQLPVFTLPYASRSAVIVAEV